MVVYQFENFAEFGGVEAIPLDIYDTSNGRTYRDDTIRVKCGMLDPVSLLLFFLSEKIVLETSHTQIHSQCL